jgi:hypothetical protein
MDITNDRIQDDVRAELASDPRLPYGVPGVTNEIKVIPSL